MLFTRPPRSMKTSCLSMMSYFLSIKNAEENKKLFEGLTIGNGEYKAFRETYQGKVPVIFFTMKNLKARTWAEMKEAFSDLMASVYRQHREILRFLDEGQKEKYQRVLNQKSSQHELKSSLADLATYLQQHHKKKVFILIDEYDTPIHSAYRYTSKDDLKSDTAYFQMMASFLSDFLSCALKSHPSVEKGYLTGVLRTAFASLLSVLNNVQVHSVLSPDLSELFGFTQSEVDHFVDQIKGIDDKTRSELRNQLQNWYDGYYFGGNAIRMYNPWSVSNFFYFLSSSQELAAKAYWLQSGDSLGLLEHLEPRFSRIQPELTRLMLRETINVQINERTSLPDLDNPNDDAAFWGLLLHTGYLSVKSVSQEKDTLFQCEVLIPNHEVTGAYARLIEKIQENELTVCEGDLDNYRNMLKPLFEGQIDEFGLRFKTYIEQVVSYFDFQTPPQKKARTTKEGEAVVHPTEKRREQFYHVFMLGLLAGAHSQYFRVSSNQEAGYGRYDLLLTPRDLSRDGIIFELKVAEHLGRVIN